MLGFVDGLKVRRTMKPTQFRRLHFCPRSVTPYARSRNFQLAHDGSSLGTNAALRRPPSVAQRHQFDYTFGCPELPSVNFTAASWHRQKHAAVDATAAAQQPAKLASVGMTNGSRATPGAHIPCKASIVMRRRLCTSVLHTGDAILACFPSIRRETSLLPLRI